MKKIFFYCPDPLERHINDNRHYVTSTPLILNSYLKIMHPDICSQIEWTHISTVPIEKEQLVKEINKLDIDILAISIFIWSEKKIYDLLSGLKDQINKKLTIIVGGPSVNPHLNKNYLLENPEIDYAIYAQGEKAFAHILKHILYQEPLTADNIKNLYWREGDKILMSAHEFLRLPDIDNYLESIELLDQQIKFIKRLPEFSNKQLVFPYGTSKGCMYKCSFCAWSGETTTKVYHRKSNFEQELASLINLGIHSIDLTDANFGQHKQDYDIAASMVKLSKEKNIKFKVEAMNLSKLNWKENLKILDLFAKNDLISSLGISISVQDTNQSVLKNIDRPGTSWDQLKTDLINLERENSKLILRLEIIQGLPGQTRETWKQTLLDIENIGEPQIYDWIQLPNSPAYKKEYIDRMQLTVKPIFVNEIEYPCIVESFSYNIDDWVYFSLLSEIVSIQEIYQHFNRKTLFDSIDNSQNLNHTLEDLKQVLFSCTADYIKMKIIYKFLISLFNEFPNLIDGTPFKTNKEFIKLLFTKVNLH